MNIDPVLNLLDNGRKLPLVEDFYTIQGEGFHAGKPAYFIRLGGCDVGCKWCDAKNTWNPSVFPPVNTDEIVARAVAYPAEAIVITGGEPLMYPLEYITSELKRRHVEIFLETSGSHELSGAFDWICLSPKRQAPPLRSIYQMADELKVIVQTAEDIEWAEWNADRVGRHTRLYLQPEWSRYGKIIADIVEYVKAHPKWNISIQTHKFMHIP